MRKIKHFIYWITGYIKCRINPIVFLGRKTYKKQWMTWAQYRLMTNNFHRKIYIR